MKNYQSIAFVVFLTTLLCVFFGCEGEPLTPKPDVEQVTIEFDYDGYFNDQPFIGEITNVMNSKTGNFTASGRIENVDEDFDPNMVGFSIVSISCSNGGKALAGTYNMVTLAKNRYTSKRSVKIFDSSGEILGDITISGLFSKVHDSLFHADVVVEGFYIGPSDFKHVEGYILPTLPIGNKLEGCFTDILYTNGGEQLIVEHEHTYDFIDGVNTFNENSETGINHSSLVPNIMDVKFHPDAIWDIESGLIEFTGNSIIKGLIQGEEPDC